MERSIQVNCIIKNKDAVIPTKAHEGDCCYDLYSAEQIELAPFERKLVDTGLIMEMPPDFEAQIRPRSGLAYKYGITVLNSPGTIDSGFRNTWKVILINLSKESYSIKVGDRIAQVKFSPIWSAEFKLKTDISNTERGVDGCGSTGR